MKVIITREMVKAHPNYSDHRGCPLFHALIEQYPDFEFKHITGYGTIAIKGKENISPKGWNSPTWKSEWNATVHSNMLDGTGPETVELEYNIK